MYNWKCWMETVKLVGFSQVCIFTWSRILDVLGDDTHLVKNSTQSTWCDKYHSTWGFRVHKRKGCHLNWQYLIKSIIQTNSWFLMWAFSVYHIYIDIWLYICHLQSSCEFKQYGLLVFSLHGLAPFIDLRFVHIYVGVYILKLHVIHCHHHYWKLWNMHSRLTWFSAHLFTRIEVIMVLSNFKDDIKR